MKKWFLLLMLALAACTQGGSNPPGAALPPAVTQKVSPATLAAAKTIPALPTSTQAGNAANAMPGCTVMSAKSTPGPTPESVFGAITEQDWATGPATAKVTLIEYSDFQ